MIVAILDLNKQQNPSPPKMQKVREIFSKKAVENANGVKE